MRRGFVLLVIIVAAIFTVVVWFFSKSVLAQSNSSFTFDGSKLTHKYTDGGPKTQTWAKYKGPVSQSYAEIYIPQFLRAARHVAGDINIVKLSMSGIKGEYFAAISTSRAGSERIIAIMARSPKDFRIFFPPVGPGPGTSENIPAGKLVAFYPDTNLDNEVNKNLFEPDKDHQVLKKYLNYLIQNMPMAGWAVTVPTAPGGCADHSAERYFNPPPQGFGYFSSSGNAIVSRNNFLPYTVPIVIKKQPVLDATGKVTTPGVATITLPKPQPSELDYDLVKNNRPEIEFTYSKWMNWRGDNNYYYFLPPASSKHCNLAIRVNDGSDKGDILAITLATSSGSQAIFEHSPAPIAVVGIERESLKEFIKGLSGGKSPDSDYKPSDKKTQTGPDEFGGQKIGSGDNPSATSSGSDDECLKVFEGGGSWFSRIFRRYTIGKAVCGMMNFMAWVAGVTLDLAFSVFIYASGLQ